MTFDEAFAQSHAAFTGNLRFGSGSPGRGKSSRKGRRKMSDPHMHFDENTGRSFFRYPGSKTKPACEVEMTNAVNAWNLLVREGRDPAKENLEGFEHLMLCLIIVCHEMMGRPVKKKELREALPGIGGDVLNLVLGGLRKKCRVSVCEDGCCYLPIRELKIE